jgi:predicted transcriptional regulator YheO
MKTKRLEHQYVFEQLRQISRGLGGTFAPFCEAVVRDLTHTGHAILAIHNNPSGREVGDPMTELVRQRISEPAFPELVANYPNRFFPTAVAPSIEESLAVVGSRSLRMGGSAHHV